MTGAGLRVIVCGDRNWRKRESILWTLRLLPSGTLIVHGACPTGADQMADEIARELQLQVAPVPAEWDAMEKQGKPRWAAGPIRNGRMLYEYNPQAVIAFHDNIHWSKGTRDMLEQAGRAHVTRMLVSSSYDEALIGRRMRWLLDRVWPQHQAAEPAAETPAQPALF